MKHYIIYVPGLGDHYDGIRRFLLRFWRLYGVRTQLVPMQWYDGEPYQAKYELIVAAVSAAQEKGYCVSLVGESAGASIAMNAFSRDDRLYRFISLCGVNSFHSSISPRILANSPAFKQSLSHLAASQWVAVRARPDSIISMSALSDSVVSVSKNRIKGVKNKRIFSVGHLTSIFLCLSIFSCVVVGEIKKK
ncbi:MAG: hypothetical protein ABI716_02585 [Candidatus Saccharibacteria bacterium]